MLKKAIENFSLVFIYRVLNYVILIFMTIKLAAYLKPSLFGIYSYLMAFITMFSSIGDFGLRHILARELSKDNDKNPYLAGSGIVLSFLFSILSFFLIVGSIRMLNNESELLRLSYVVGLTIIVCQLFCFYCSIFRGFEELKYEAALRFLRQLSLLAAVLFLISFNLKLLSIFYAYLITYFLFFILGILISKKLLKSDYHFKTKFFKELLRLSMPVGLSLIFFNIGLEISIIALKYYADNSVVGLFSAAYKVILSVVSIYYVLCASFIPLFKNLAKDINSNRKHLTSLAKYNFIIIIVIVISGALFAEKIYLLFLGESYNLSATMFQYLIIGVLFLLPAILFSFILIALDRQKLFTLSSSFFLLFTLIFNLILIPKYGWKGACIGTISGQIIFFIGSLLLLRNCIKIPLLNSMVKPLVSGAAMVCFLYFFRSGNLLIQFIELALGLVIYVSSLFLLNTFSEGEILFLKKSVRIKGKPLNLTP